MPSQSINTVDSSSKDVGKVLNMWVVTWASKDAMRTQAWAFCVHCVHPSRDIQSQRTTMLLVIMLVLFICIEVRELQGNKGASDEETLTHTPLRAAAGARHQNHQASTPPYPDTRKGATTQTTKTTATTENGDPDVGSCGGCGDDGGSSSGSVAVDICGAIWSLRLHARPERHET